MSEHKHVAATRKDAVKKVVDDAKIPMWECSTWNCQRAEQKTDSN